MEFKISKIDFIKFIFISIIYSIGFIIIYLTNLNLTTATTFQAKLFEIFILGVQNKSFAEFIFSYFKPILYLILALLFFCYGLSFLAVKKLDDIKYFLILTILPLGILFNFSILFLLFSLGLYVASLYSISLGEIYKEEIKKWRAFRVGSNAVNRALFVLFLFVLLGSILTFSIDETYKQSFINTTISGLKNIAKSEIKNFETRSLNVKEDLVKSQIEKIRKQYSNLTEEQYAEIERNLRESIGNLTAAPGAIDISDILESSLENSLIINSLSYWFPFFMSFTIWFLLEFLRSFLLSPISGLFSIFFFKFGEY
jgi:hypothetical protein